VQGQERRKNPLWVIAIVISLVLVAFILRLYQLQVVQHQQYATLSRDNFLATGTLRALRGVVYARDGRTVLISNREAVDLVYKGGEVRFLDRIARLAGLNDPLPKLERGEEKILVKNIPSERVLPLSEWIAGQDSLELRNRMERYYPAGVDGNLLGATTLAGDTPEEVRAGYEIDDLKGNKGLEAGLEGILRGRNGFKLVEVNAGGRAVGERIQQPATRGRDVTLTIDMKLQRAAQSAIQAALADINRLNVKNGVPTAAKPRGAIVALNPQTGEVLALATGPTVDPNWFAQRPRPPQMVEALRDSKYLPLWNRAVRIFEPGSTFKLVTASALLENGFGNRAFQCYSGWPWGGRTWRNWNRSRNMGVMDARAAIANSCNTWYYQSAVAFGPQAFAEVLARRAREFGFGEPSGVEFVGEQTDPVPSPSSYRAEGLDWPAYKSLNFAIGQELRATPLEVARMLATIVNDGVRPELTLVKAIDHQAIPPKPRVKLEGRYWQLLKEGMRWTTTERSGQPGTAYWVLGPKFFPIATGGKTGTAQTPQGVHRDHAWYMGFGPYDKPGDKPDLVVVAFFENGVEGSGVALPAVRRVMAAHWNVPLDEQGNVIWSKWTGSRQ
jgi:penicillin-binding protein 2